MFKCSKCGLCCKQIAKMPQIYGFLDNGKGQCKYFDETTNLCTIYKQRPIICNIDESYKLYFSDVYSLEEFYELNYRACKTLQMKGGANNRVADSVSSAKGN